MGDPIEDIKRACERILADTGERDPRRILISATTYARIKALLEERERRRTWRPGIDD